MCRFDTRRTLAQFAVNREIESGDENLMQLVCRIQKAIESRTEFRGRERIAGVCSVVRLMSTVRRSTVRAIEDCTCILAREGQGFKMGPSPVKSQEGEVSDDRLSASACCLLYGGDKAMLHRSMRAVHHLFPETRMPAPVRSNRLTCCCGLFALVLTAVFSLSQVRADDEGVTPPPGDMDRWMALKLTSSQRIFEGLTKGDFEQMERAARRMNVMNLLEQWSRDNAVRDQSDYQGQLNAFDFATKELVRHAGDHDMDGALKAYVAMSESCVRCHQVIRDVKKP